MIQNEHQYRITRQERDNIAHALNALDEVALNETESPTAFTMLLRGLERASLQGVLADLEKDLHGWETREGVVS